MGHATSILETGQARRAHMVGIGGSGMRALARVLLDKRLAAERLGHVHRRRRSACQGRRLLFSGHAAQHVSPDVECVIHSSAIPADNPELLRAAELGIPILSYAELLGMSDGRENGTGGRRHARQVNHYSNGR